MRKAICKMIRNLIFFIVLIILTFWLIFKDQNMSELFDVVKSANTLYILSGVLLMFLFYLTEAYNIRSILKSFGEKISIFQAIKFTLIGFFFSAITPAASGGQPVEIYYMTKEKISGAKATMALLVQLCGYQISTILLGLICAILNPALLNGGIAVLFIIGLLINSFALSIMLICIFSRRLAKKILKIFVKILKAFKVKKIDEKKQRIEEGFERYSESSIYIRSHKKTFIRAIIRVFIQISFYYSVPFCVYKAFGLNTHSFMQIFSIQAVLYTTVSGLPLPGAVGISETVFLKMFNLVFGKELLSGAMLLNRGITFYLFVIISLIVVIINAIIKKNVKGEIDKDFGDSSQIPTNNLLQDRIFRRVPKSIRNMRKKEREQILN